MTLPSPSPRSTPARRVGFAVTQSLPPEIPDAGKVERYWGLPYLDDVNPMIRDLAVEEQARAVHAWHQHHGFALSLDRKRWIVQISHR